MTTPEDKKSHGFSSTSTSPSEVPSSSVFYYDNVTVSIVPEKKGLFLKHSEYEVIKVLIGYS